MVKWGVITEVTEPTECMVCWHGSGSKAKWKGENLCKLNANVCQEQHVLPSVVTALAQLGGAKYFTKLDANVDRNGP